LSFQVGWVLRYMRTPRGLISSRRRTWLGPLSSGACCRTPDRRAAAVIAAAAGEGVVPAATAEQVTAGAERCWRESRPEVRLRQGVPFARLGSRCESGAYGLELEPGSD